MLIHASWKRVFSIFHCVKVSFGSMGVFQRANGHSKTRIDVWRCYVLGSAKTCLWHFTSDSIPFRSPWCHTKDTLTISVAQQGHTPLLFWGTTRWTRWFLKAGWLEMDNVLRVTKNCPIFPVVLCWCVMENPHSVFADDSTYQRLFKCQEERKYSSFSRVQHGASPWQRNPPAILILSNTPD